MSIGIFRLPSGFGNKRVQYDQIENGQLFYGHDDIRTTLQNRRILMKTSTGFVRVAGAYMGLAVLNAEKDCRDTYELVPSGASVEITQE